MSCIRKDFHRLWEGKLPDSIRMTLEQEEAEEEDARFSEGISEDYPDLTVELDIGFAQELPEHSPNQSFPSDDDIPDIEPGPEAADIDSQP